MPITLIYLAFFPCYLITLRIPFLGFLGIQVALLAFKQIEGFVYHSFSNSMQEEKIQLLKYIYITYIEKDIPRQYNIKENGVRDLSIALALQAGSLINYNEISEHIGTYYKKIIEMIDALESTYIIKRLRSFSRNLRNEIKKSPKAYFYDLGMRNYLAQNFNYPGLRSGVEAGALAETAKSF
ncbi:MAG: DUF4143 domain-containing protein [Candidatus Marsarchaeota archaeon]|nr:DUF4143 domain-containing protein [Candidatus Marsarchaeota archaeon]